MFITKAYRNRITIIIIIKPVTVAEKSQFGRVVKKSRTRLGQNIIYMDAIRMRLFKHEKNLTKIARQYNNLIKQIFKTNRIKKIRPVRTDKKNFEQKYLFTIFKRTFSPNRTKLRGFQRLLNTFASISIPTLVSVVKHYVFKKLRQ